MQLHITNGDSATALMRQAGLPGLHLPWRDLLHEGPAPNALTLEQLSQCRTEFIATRGWGTRQQIEADFIARDQQLRRADQFQQVVLWFEHDLYDQLQLLQLLDHFHHQPHPQLSLICTDHYLGQQTPASLLELRRFEQPVSPEQTALASRAWQALRAPSPEDWFALLAQDCSALPFLKDAVIRLLQEYPNSDNGLSRSARQIVDIASANHHPADDIVNRGITAAELFRRCQQREQSQFMGDASFWQLLQQLVDAAALAVSDNQPLCHPGRDDDPRQAGAQQLSLTARGLALRNGRIKWWELVEIDHWIGGVKLEPEKLWLWDQPNAQIRLQHSRKGLPDS